MKRLVSIGLLLLLAAGCAPNAAFVYKTSAPAAGGPKVPVKIAVLPFADGTENFEVIGSKYMNTPIRRFNIVKCGPPGIIDALPPEFWAKAFADELSASGRFEGVRFLYDRSELADEAYLVEGTVQKAYHDSGALGGPNEFALAFRALGRAEGRPVWEKAVARNWKEDYRDFDKCGALDDRCRVDLTHDVFRQVMQGMFDEAGADLAAKLAPLAGGGAGAGANPTDAPPEGPAQGSVDETIESILKGK